MISKNLDAKKLRVTDTELALPLPLEYIVMLGKGGGSIPKSHHRPALATDAASAAVAWFFCRPLPCTFSPLNHRRRW